MVEKLIFITQIVCVIAIIFRLVVFGLIFLQHRAYNKALGSKLVNNLSGGKIYKGYIEQLFWIGICLAIIYIIS